MATKPENQSAVQLQPNVEGKGNWAEWMIAFLVAKGHEPREVQQALSCVETGRGFSVPLPNRTQIITDNTQQPALFGNPPGVATPPDEATVNALMISASVERQKKTARVKDAGTAAFQFLESCLSHESQVLVREHPDYVASNGVEPKDPFALWRIVKATHATGGAAGIRLTSQELRRLEREWVAFQMGQQQTIGDFHLHFTQWMDRRIAAGLPALQMGDQVTIFYAKLDPVRYAALAAQMENDERKELLAGREPVHGTLAQALAHVRGWKDPNVKQAAGGKRVSVFTAPDGGDGGADSVAAACATLAAATGLEQSAVLVALKNAVPKKSGKGWGGPPPNGWRQTLDPAVLGAGVWRDPPVLHAHANHGQAAQRRESAEGRCIRSEAEG